MVALGRLEVVGPLPGSGFAGELLGLLTNDRSPEPQPVRLVPVPPHVISDPALIAQLGRDATAAAELLHPDILRSYGIEDVQGTTMQILAYVEAHPLRKVLQVGGRLPPPMAARILVDAARALQYAHDKGKGSRLQGEISLDTVMVAEKGTALVVGLGGPTPSRVAREQLPLRSPEEIVAGSSVLTPETDVYLLGSLLYACLTGDLPFADEPDPDGAVVSMRVPSLANHRIPPPLAAVVVKSLAKKAQDRFRSPGVLADEIARATGELAEPSALATYVELLFPDDTDRDARRAAVQTALTARGVNTGDMPETSAAPPAAPTAPPAPVELVEPPVQAAPAAPAPAEVAPPVEPPRPSQPDLVSTMDIVMEPPRPPPRSEEGQAESAETATSKEARPPYAPELIRTMDIVMEPPGPEAEPEPVEPVGNADIVADAGRGGAAAELTKAAFAPELIRTIDIVQDTPAPGVAPAELPEEEGVLPWSQPLPPAEPESKPPWMWLGVVVLLCLAIGFCLSFFLGVGVPAKLASQEPTGPTLAKSAPAPGAITPPSHALLGQSPSPRAPEPEPEPVPPSVEDPKAKAEPRAQSTASISVAGDPPGNIYVDGKLVGQAPLVKPVTRGAHRIRLRNDPNGIDVTRIVDVRGPETRVRFVLGKGSVTVTAPAGAIIFIDGRKVGTTEVRQFPVWEGEHKLLVTLGTARQAQSFQLGPGETYTYEVTQTAAQ